MRISGIRFLMLLTLKTEVERDKGFVLFVFVVEEEKREWEIEEEREGDEGWEVIVHSRSFNWIFLIMLWYYENGWTEIPQYEVTHRIYIAFCIVVTKDIHEELYTI